MTISIKSLGGEMNDAPVISDLQMLGKADQTTIGISYKVTDTELQIVRHYLTVSGVCEKKEITKDVGYEAEGNVFNYKIRNLSPGKQYSVQIMCDDGLSQTFSEVVQLSTSSDWVLGFKIHEFTQDPYSSVEYIEGAAGMTPAVGSDLKDWEDKYPFRDLRLVAYKNHTFYKEVSKKNMAQYVDGSTVEADVDVFLEIPKFYWKHDYSDNTCYTVTFSNKKLPGYTCEPFLYRGQERNKLLIACYHAGGTTSRTRSNRLVPMSKFRTNDIVGYNGYSIAARDYINRQADGMDVYLHTSDSLMKYLFILRYKTRDSKSALGLGGTGANGTLDHLGWIGADSNGVVFLGVQHLYSKLSYTYLGGIMTHSTYRSYGGSYSYDYDHYADTKGSFSNGSNWQYKLIAEYDGVDDNPYAMQGYVSRMNRKGGLMIADELGASETTCYCSRQLNKSKTPGDYTSVVGNCNGTLFGTVWVDSGVSTFYRIQRLVN